MARASVGVTIDRVDSLCVMVLVMAKTALMRIGTESQKIIFWWNCCIVELSSVDG